MTLLELLRQELPKRGGWPEGAKYITQDSKTCTTPGNVYAYETKPVPCGGYWVDNDCTSGYGSLIFKTNIIADDSTTAIVTREQYETTGWDGANLPPVGCECEIYNRGEWFAVKLKFIGDKWIVAEVLENGHEDCYELVQDSGRFRPLRTEAERAIDEMVQLSGVSTGAAKILYNAGYRKG